MRMGIKFQWTWPFVPNLFFLLIYWPLQIFCMKTTVPDEIIKIVTSETYNRHHLPSQAAALNRFTPYKRELGDRGWRLSMEFQPQSFQKALELVQFDSEERVGKMTFDMRGTEKLADELALTREKFKAFEYPTNVSIGIYIEGMSSFRAQSMDFHMDIYFSEEWTDRRLAHSSEEPVLIKDLQVYDLLWHPDLYFANAKESKYHSVTSPNFMVWVFNDGRVNLDTRISLVVNCMMDLTNYPLDDQECYLRILSYAYDIENLNIFWKEKNITKNPEIKLPDMQLKDYRADFCAPVEYEAGVWACVRAVFQMERQVMHHVLQSYIPSGLIVIISWFSFWLDVDAVPGRVSLCITTLLTLATQSSAARMALPQVSYAKAIDVWMGTCMAFVFGVMIEFTAVNYLARFSLSDMPGYVGEDENGNEDGGDGGVGYRARGLRRRLRPKPTRTTSSIEFHDLLFDPSDCEIPSKQKPDNHDPRIPALPSTTPSRCLDRQNSDKFSAVSLSEADIEVKRRQNHRKALRVDRICRVGFPLTFIIFNSVYWPYYITAESSHTPGVSV